MGQVPIELLVQKLEEVGVLKHHKLRTHTTVVESDVRHPTDASLLQDDVKESASLVGTVRKVVSHVVQQFKDKTKEVKAHILSTA